MDWVAETFRPGQVLFSLMSQYTPQAPWAVSSSNISRSRAAETVFPNRSRLMDLFWQNTHPSTHPGPFGCWRARSRYGFRT